MREVSQLPDLTPAQKKQIGAIYSQERQALEALRSEQESGNGSAGSGGGGGFQAARGQFRAKRAETWEKVKPLLTPQQLEELKNMQVQGGGSPSASAGGARDSGRQAGAPQASGDSKPESDSE
jgi:Spy/CpxP family protein refolding chaperone